MFVLFAESSMRVKQEEKTYHSIGHWALLYLILTHPLLITMVNLKKCLALSNVAKYKNMISCFLFNVTLCLKLVFYVTLCLNFETIGVISFCANYSYKSNANMWRYMCNLLFMCVIDFTMFIVGNVCGGMCIISTF